MLLEAGYVCFDFFLDRRVQEVVVAVIPGGFGPGCVYECAVLKILVQLVDQELQCFLLLDVDDALPLVFVDFQGVVPDVDIQDLRAQCLLAAASGFIPGRDSGIPGRHDFHHEWESPHHGGHHVFAKAHRFGQPIEPGVPGGYAEELQCFPCPLHKDLGSIEDDGVVQDPVATSSVHGRWRRRQFEGNDHGEQPGVSSRGEKTLSR